MSFLSPWSALLASAIAIPILLLLYVLRLRRQRLRISSTLLWQKSFEDLQANAPFQRLRWSLLLALQFLLLAILLLALAEPAIKGSTGFAARIVLLIDRSASMNAAIEGLPRTDHVSRTRLDAARDIATRMINDLGRASQPSEMMIVAFGSAAQVVSPFQSDRTALLEAVRSIEPTDEQANLDAALQLAGAFTGTSKRGQERSSVPPDVILLSDGGVGRAAGSAGFSLRAGRFQLIQVVPSVQSRSRSDATPIDNLGIASLSVRRDYEDPSHVLVFARLVNSGAEAVDTVATLFVDNVPAASMRRSVPPTADSGLGEESLTYSLDLPSGGVLLLRHDHTDDLPADDAAAVVLPAPARPRIALVHPDDSASDQFLHDLLAALEPATLQTLSSSAFANIDPQQVDSPMLFDLVVFDRVSARRLPGVPSLTVGGTPTPLREIAPSSPPNNQTTPAETPLAGQSILSWDRQHPVMRNVALDGLVYAGFNGYELPPSATPLAFGSTGPVMAALRTRSARHLAVGFQMAKSNWPLQVSCAVFMQNALDYLTLADSGQNGLSYRPGDPVTVRASADAHEISITGPLRASLAVTPGASVTLPVFHRAGLYKVTGAAPPNDRVAVSVLSDMESDIRPRSAIMVNAEAAQAHPSDRAMAQPLWPWLIAAAFALLVLEWLVYCWRVRG